MKKLIDDLCQVMNILIEKFDEYYNMQYDYFSLTRDKDWNKAALLQEDMVDLCIEIENLETDRSDVVEKLRQLLMPENDPIHARFVHLIEYFPENERKQCQQLSIQLQQAVYRVRHLSTTINSYLTMLSSTFDSMIDQFYPENSGMTYDARGEKQKHKDGGNLFRKSL